MLEEVGKRPRGDTPEVAFSFCVGGGASNAIA